MGMVVCLGAITMLDDYRVHINYTMNKVIDHLGYSVDRHTD